MFSIFFYLGMSPEGRGDCSVVSHLASIQGTLDSAPHTTKKQGQKKQKKNKYPLTIFLSGHRKLKKNKIVIYLCPLIY